MSVKHGAVVPTVQTRPGGAARPEPPRCAEPVLERGSAPPGGAEGGGGAVSHGIGMERKMENLKMLQD